MNSKLACAFSCFFLLSGALQANDSVDLKVTATLEAGSCTPSLSNNGEADFGHVPLHNLSKTSTNQLGSRFLTLTINCTQASQIGWTVTDNKKDSVQSLTIKNAKFVAGDLDDIKFEYGLGKTQGGINIGAYTIYTDLNNVTGDGQKLKVMYKTGNGGWLSSGAGEIKNDPTHINSAEIWGGTDAVVYSAKTFIWPLKLTAAIQGTEALSISDSTPLDGSSTISIVYL
ncbi:DUF1120 domain-containing protein [Cronobacter turicensis]|uniref:DUF1120 domain-containing protein n=1 Tax=Cronobacter turicensis TaxID=413502 RepID=UPI0011ADC710|nr:DUF1120 domain-containing protein [Cronobacter turicensis]TWR36692.1 DUF1120 domain-containing protein [Cronobacter turicensis]